MAHEETKAEGEKSWNWKGAIREGTNEEHLVAEFQKVCEGLSLDVEEVCSIGEPQELCLLRYLRANNNEIPKALEQLRGTHSWRREEGIPALVQQSPQAILGCDPARVVQFYPHWQRGVDRLGRPILIKQYGGFETWHLKHLTTLPALVRWHAWEQEQNAALLARQSARAGAPITQFCIIVDVKHMVLKQVNRDFLWMVKRIAAIDSAHHPERMGKTFIINTPKVFPMVWRGVTPFLDKNTVAKIEIYAKEKDWRPALQRAIAPDQLPPEYGGTGPPLHAAHATAAAARSREASSGGRRSSLLEGLGAVGSRLRALSHSLSSGEEGGVPAATATATAAAAAAAAWPGGAVAGSGGVLLRRRHRAAAAAAAAGAAAAAALGTWASWARRGGGGSERAAAATAALAAALVCSAVLGVGAAVVAVAAVKTKMPHGVNRSMLALVRTTLGVTAAAAAALTVAAGILATKSTGVHHLRHLLACIVGFILLLLSCSPLIHTSALATSASAWAAWRRGGGGGGGDDDGGSNVEAGGGGAAAAATGEFPLRPTIDQFRSTLRAATAISVLVTTSGLIFAGSGIGYISNSEKLQKEVAQLDIEFMLFVLCIFCFLTSLIGLWVSKKSATKRRFWLYGGIWILVNSLLIANALFNFNKARAEAGVAALSAAAARGGAVALALAAQKTLELQAAMKLYGELNHTHSWAPPRFKLSKTEKALAAWGVISGLAFIFLNGAFLVLFRFLAGGRRASWVTSLWRFLGRFDDRYTTQDSFLVSTSGVLALVVGPGCLLYALLTVDRRPHRHLVGLSVTLLQIYTQVLVFSVAALTGPSSSSSSALYTGLVVATGVFRLALPALVAVVSLQGLTRDSVAAARYKRLEADDEVYSYGDMAVKRRKWLRRRTNTNIQEEAEVRSAQEGVCAPPRDSSLVSSVDASPTGGLSSLAGNLQG